MKTKNITNTSFLLSIIFQIRQSNYDLKNALINKIENLKNIFQQAQIHNLQAIYNDFKKIFINFVEFIFTNKIDFFKLIDTDQLPQPKTKICCFGKLKKLYSDYFNLLMNAVEQFKNLDFAELMNKNIPQLNEYNENTLKFLFYFILTDMFLNKEIKLNRPLRKALYNELKQNGEIYFAMLNLTGVFNIDLDTENQTERNIIIISRIIATKHNLSKTHPINNINDLINLASNV